MAITLMTFIATRHFCCRQLACRRHYIYADIISHTMPLRADYAFALSALSPLRRADYFATH